MSKGLALAKLTIALCVTMTFSGCGPEPGVPYCAIHVIDAETGRGIPAIRLQSLNKASYITDSHGYIAYYEPGLMGRQVYFEIDAEGYRVDLDETGRHAISLDIEEGAEVEVPMRRVQAAERLYRLTGQGIYRESLFLGKPAPIQHPVINGGVLGQDSNLGVKYKSGLFWVWGDSFLAGQYKGNFSVSAATSELPGHGGLDPDIGVDYTYFMDVNGESRRMIDIEGQGYTWFEWLVNLPDETGEERLVAKYARVGGLWQNYERGIAIFNDESGLFERYSDSKEWLSGFAVMQHPFMATDGNDTFMYANAEFDFTRVAPLLDSVASPKAYYTFTCMKEGAGYNASEPELERDDNGQLVYGWKPNSEAIDAARQAELIASGMIRPEEGWIQLRDMSTHHQHRVRRGSVNWNPHRQKWILIAQGDGDYLGEVVYSEADSPIGPWAYAAVVAEHDNLFYNPVHHAFFDKRQFVYFEGTYTNFWNQGATKEYYDYNQLQYRLDLENEQAMIPSAVYRLHNNDLAFASTILKEGLWQDVTGVAFYAFEPHHKPDQAVPYYKRFDGDLSLSDSGAGEPFMYALEPQFDPFDKLPGKWDCHIKSFVAIDAYMPLEISRQGPGWYISSSSSTMYAEYAGHTEERLSIEMTQYGNKYILSCDVNSIAKGEILGVWQKVRSDGTKSPEYLWDGVKTDPGWLPSTNRHLITINNMGEETDDAALCRVWPDPHDQLFLAADNTPILDNTPDE